LCFCFFAAILPKNKIKQKVVWANHFDSQNNEFRGLGDNYTALAK
jgi:hypothetical protein